MFYINALNLIDEPETNNGETEVQETYELAISSDGLNFHEGDEQPLQLNMPGFDGNENEIAFIVFNILP